VIPNYAYVILGTFIILIVVWFVRNLMRDQKICDRCRQRMWFWEMVVMHKVKKENMPGWKTFSPVRHVRCEDG